MKTGEMCVAALAAVASDPRSRITPTGAIAIEIAMFGTNDIPPPIISTKST